MSNKYCESLNCEAVDWYAFLANPNLTLEEVEDVHPRARDWVTCACGNQCKDIPRDTEGRPYDDELRNLGHYFFLKIDRMKDKLDPYFSKYSDKIESVPTLQEDALVILKQIEQRASKILKTEELF